MSHDTLAIIWFALWGVIWTVYFILDAYSLGTGMLFGKITKDRAERNQLQEAIGPFWNGNEVWLITAGGATFAAFPIVYADMFSFLYEAMMLILFALILRAASLEFMHKDDHPKWIATCKWTFIISSFALPVLFGVAFSNLYYGLLIGPNGYEGNLFSLLHRYALLGGALFVALFMTSGALWIMIKTAGEVAERASKIARYTSIAAGGILPIYFVATANKTFIFDNFNDNPILYAIPLLCMITAIMTIVFVFKNKVGLAFTNVCLTIGTFMATGFIGMFPRMLPSRINDALSITLFEARGSELNLKIMFGVAMVTVPIVISYQLWSYTLFKTKLTKQNAKGYH
ncbi:cytochrome d ubiquinol oxidase subunit II [Priestia taiwanensis]|uniref:Cytochrome c oxidase assembly protein n=1 Tax=Priestia taiwanensis TaxID=1347902 RepID=A0A917ER27_9BACI|nr:cytochrome d ubiquinol oxidase subunit II [Priestia taiwanensis]MBM7363332.1 cytochrome d ubiquinol oxidase subunit II [Priestia taiwanensis]GGE78047.1 cytochrome c oxidase assembly protein [Priestia taiwanensis]